MYQVNNSVTFREKSIRTEEVLNQMVEALGISIIDRRSNARPRKIES